MTRYDPDIDADLELPPDMEGEHSLPTAEEVRNLQEFIEDEKKKVRAGLTRKQMYTLGGLLGLLIIVIMAMSIAIAQNKRSARGSTRERAVVNFLSDNFADRTALEEKDSPQKRAARWIADEDKLNMPLPASNDYEDAYKFVQRYALAVLYFAWSGEDEWIFNYQFLSGQDECDWNYKYKTDDSDEAFELGVKCNDDKEVEYLFMRKCCSGPLIITYYSPSFDCEAHMAFEFLFFHQLAMVWTEQSPGKSVYCWPSPTCPCSTTIWRGSFLYR
jgi:hypothetical protein